MVDVAHVVHAHNGRAIASVVLCLAEQMQSRGLDVVVVASSVTRDALPSRGVEVVDLGGAGRRTLPTIPALARELRTRRPATVIAHAEGPIRAAVAATRTQRERPRLLGVVHNHYSSYPWKAPRVRRILDDAAFRRLEALIGVSPGVAADLAETFPAAAEKVHVIPPPLTRWDDLADLAAARPAHPWFDDERPTIVAVGHIHPRKDHGTLVRAVAELRSRGGTVPRVAIIGSTEGGHAARLADLVTELGLENDVSLLGAMVNPIAYVAAADVLVLSSTNEGFGLVLLEAMAVGTAVVSTDAPSGPRWVLDDGRAGLLTAVADPVALADALATLLEDDALRADFERTGRDRAAEFTPATVTERYLSVMGAR